MGDGLRLEPGALTRLRELLTTSLFRNSFFLLARSFLNYGLGFLFWLVVARFYREADVGLSAAMLSTLLLLARGAALGLPTGMLRFLPSEQDKIGLLNGVFTLSVVTSIPLGLAFLAGLGLWAPAFSPALSDPVLATVFIASLVFFTLDGAMDNAFVAARRSDYGMIRSTIFYTLRLPLAIAVVSFGVFGIMFSWTIALVVSVVVMGFLLVKFYPGYRPKPTIKRIRGTGIVGFSLWTNATGIVQGAAVFLLPLMIINVLGPANGAVQSAYFYAAYSLASLLYLVPVSFTTALLVEGAHPGTSYVRDVRATLRYSVPILVAGMIGTLVLGRPILDLFGPRYANGFNSLLLMVFASPVILLTSIYTTDLRVAKQVRPIFYITTISSVFTLVAAYFLLPSIGILGAAIAFVAGQVLAIPLYLVEKRRAVRESPSRIVAP